MNEKEILIRVTDKRAALVCGPVIVCGNSDYTARFEFDEEWAGMEWKTARFVWPSPSGVVDVPFQGDTVAVPRLDNTKEVLIGVFSGNLCTTTAARVPCVLSIRCGSGAPSDPTPSQYDQIIELLNNGGAGGGGAPGGYYVPLVEQLTADTLEFSFSPTDPDTMLSVLPKTVSLPAGPAISAATYGAIGDGVADDTGAIQAALDASHASGGGIVAIPTGTYLLSDALKFYSNQHIAGEPGAVLLQKDGNTGGAYGNLMRNFYNGSGGYDATENVIIEGLTFDGGTQETSPATLLAFCHAQNIEIRGCTFINGYSDSNTVGNGHDIEVNSSHNVRIANCTFSNNRRIGYFSELVQIDTAMSSEVYPWGPDEGERSDDGTASDTITVVGCLFEGVYRETLAQRSVFVGSHSNQKNKNILVRDCRMTYSSYAIRFADVDGLVVRDNIIGDVGVGIYVEKSDTGALAVGNTFIGDVQTAYPKRVIGHGNMLNGVHIEEPENSGGIEVSGAEVGQFLKVAAVDEKGVPTAWETVDAPVGGSAEFRHIRTVTIPDDVTTDTSGVTFVVKELNDCTFGFDTDEDGNPFDLHELLIFSNASTSHTSSSFALHIDSNLGGYGISGSSISTQITIGTSGAKKDSFSVSVVSLDGTSISWGSTFAGGVKNTVVSGAKPFKFAVDKISRISCFMPNLGVYGFSAGSKFEFYGR